jgi:hypothetical protein
MTLVSYQGHWHELDHVDWRWEDGVALAYDTHGYIFAEIPINEIEER